MNDVKTILVCEFITAGGFVGVPLPQELVKEGMLMRDQLCLELISLPQYQVVSMHDHRLAPAVGITNSMAIQSDFYSMFQSMLVNVDLVWIIAPETDDILYQLTLMCEEKNTPAIGLSSKDIEIMADKRLTAKWLNHNEIATPFTYEVSAWTPQMNTTMSHVQWLAKPTKGVGCEGVILFNNALEVGEWITTLSVEQLGKHLIQTYLLGQPASMSILCHYGKAYLLACNRLITKQNGQAISLIRININDFADEWSLFQALANQIAEHLPNACGYIGVDLILDEKAKQLTVLEINPRLSSSYVGLGEACDLNIAQCLVQAYTEPDFVMPKISRNKLTIDLV